MLIAAAANIGEINGPRNGRGYPTAHWQAGCVVDQREERILPDWNEDMLPFTHDDFLEVFRAYNAAIWPAQIVAYALGLAAVILLVPPNSARGRAILAILALMWLWVAIIYHWGFFSAINRVAFSSPPCSTFRVRSWRGWPSPVKSSSASGAASQECLPSV